jgi:hypothetical protein
MDVHQEAKQRASSPQLTFLRAVAIKLNEQGKLTQPISATDIADSCLEEDIEMPGLTPDKQTVEEGRKQIGRILSKLFGRGTELAFDEFKVVKTEATSRTMTGNEQRLNRYTFSLVNAPDQPQITTAQVPTSETTPPPAPPPDPASSNTPRPLGDENA